MDAGVFGLKDKVAMVVGGGRGMGRSSSLWLAQAGCHVSVIDFDDDLGQKVSQEVKDLGRKSVHVHADVSKVSECQKMVAESVKKLGKVDVVVNIVGGSMKKMAVDFTEAEYDQVQVLNAKYVFFTNQAFAKHAMETKHGGSIVNISSISGYDSSPYHSTYGIAKAGLINLTKSLATEWGPHGIRINSIAPGSIATPKAAGDYATMPERRKRLEEIVPLRRFGTTDEIAKVVLFFASDLSSYVTGQTIPVDGGRTALYKYWMASEAGQVV